VIGLLTLLSALAIVALGVPVWVLAFECVAGMLPWRPRPSVTHGARPGAAILIPAHDEEAGLGATLTGVRRELGPKDRLIVVCDNCSDGTAAVARAAGAEVLERRDPERRGKGYAITFALQALAADPPDVVVVIDADCSVGPGALDALVRLAVQSRRPVQAQYLLEAPADATMRMRVSAFAIRVRNGLRLAGLARLGGTSQLVGSGMAFPWEVLAQAEAMRDNLVEDLALGIDCARRGHPPLFCPEATVSSVLPSSDGAGLTQRRRWETGQLSTLRRSAWVLVCEGIGRRSWALVALGLDLAVPPLSLLGVLLAAAGVLGILAALAGAPVLAAGIALQLIVAACALTAAWATAGRRVLPARAVLALPAYVLWKIPVYLGFLTKGAEKKWVRTERGTP
jgi:cellulose synthase/poly-beta-1,6-N-acetylglucosamine synthase-like glycosyltransferase